MNSLKLEEDINQKEKTRKISKKITTINVENIPCYCSIGIDEKEKKTGQRLLIDVHANIESASLTKSDNINDTLSYVEIFRTVQRVAQSKSHSLIETLAEDIASALLDHDLVMKTKIKITKPHIPFPEFHGDVSVEVEREK